MSTDVAGCYRICSVALAGVPNIVSASLSLVPGSTGYDGTSLSVSLGVSLGNNGQATATFTKVSNMSGSTTLVNGERPLQLRANHKRLHSTDVERRLRGVRSCQPGQAGRCLPLPAAPAPSNAFFGDTVSQITKGTWSYNGQSYGFTNLFTRLSPLVNSLGADVVHVQPGVDLVNSRATSPSAATGIWRRAVGDRGKPIAGPSSIPHRAI